MNDTTEVDVGAVLNGKYALAELLGKGGFGAVYRARHVLGGYQVVVKLAHSDGADRPDTRTRFMREARAVMRLRSSRTVTVYDVDEDESGRPFIVMEYLDGTTLDVVAEKYDPNARRLPAALVVTIAQQVCEALTEAHTNRVVHRDLKPENIMVLRSHDERVSVKVLDFGIARLASRSPSEPVLTETMGGFVGSPVYVSPEMCQGHPVDGRSDLYSLGVVMYELLSGRRPITAESPTAYLIAHVMDPPVPLSDACPDLPIDHRLARLVMSLLKKVPDQRPSSAEAVAADLSAIAEALARPEPTPVRQRWRRWAAAAGLALVTMLSVAAVAGDRQGEDKAALADSVRSLTPAVPCKWTDDWAHLFVASSSRRAAEAAVGEARRRPDELTLRDTPTQVLATTHTTTARSSCSSQRRRLLQLVSQVKLIAPDPRVCARVNRLARRIARHCGLLPLKLSQRVARCR